jgi:NB-ARC domain
LIFADNYETVSYELNDKSKQPSQNAIDINFLNDNIPNNTSILLTSREKNNKLAREEVIDLEGLGKGESIDLFNGLVTDKLLKNPKNKKVIGLIQNLLKKTGGHPLSIELIAKNITSVEELDGISESLGTAEVHRTESEKRFESLKACFGYTLNKLDNALRELLPKLTLFKSPFPMSAPLEIFTAQKSDIINLYGRSLLTRIDSENPDYLLYDIHPALRSYLQNISDKNLESEYGEAFSRYYLNFLSDIFNEWDKDHVASIAQFNNIAESESSDFNRAIQLAKNNRQVAAGIASKLGLIFSNLDIATKALAYHRRSLRIHEELNDRVGIAKDWENMKPCYHRFDILINAGSFSREERQNEELNDSH